MKGTLPKNLLFLIAAFIIFTFLVQLGAFSSLDRTFTSEVQKFIPRFLDLPLSLFSLLGTVELASLVFLLILAKTEELNKLIVLLSYLSTGVFELLGKSLVSQIAPPISLLRTVQFFKVPSGEVSGHFFSYPSGHSARTAFISALLALVVWANPKMKAQTKKIVTILLVLFDLIMFGSRIYLGEHWMTDVIGGAILGFGLFGVSIFLSRRFSSG